MFPVRPFNADDFDEDDLIEIYDGTVDEPLPLPEWVCRTEEQQQAFLEWSLSQLEEPDEGWEAFEARFIKEQSDEVTLLLTLEMVGWEHTFTPFVQARKILPYLTWDAFKLARYGVFCPLPPSYEPPKPGRKRDEKLEAILRDNARLTLIFQRFFPDEKKDRWRRRTRPDRHQILRKRHNIPIEEWQERFADKIEKARR